MSKRNYFLTAMLLLLLVSTQMRAAPLPLHTFHTSLMQVEYNAKEQLVEFSIQVFVHDLENTLSHRSGKEVRLDKTPNAAQLTFEYLKDAVSLKSRDGKLQSFTWVGMEPDADAVWLYVETKMPEGLDGAQLRDRLFFDSLDDQVNLVHLKYNGKKADLVFKPGEDFKVIEESKPEQKS